jgi:transposase InsO family protein
LHLAITALDVLHQPPERRLRLVIDRFEDFLQLSRREAPPLCYSPAMPFAQMQQCRYLRFGLSYRDVEELLTERGVEVDHVTIYRWVLRFTPMLAEAARPCRHAVGDRWQVDETYVKVAGHWRYVYRAIDQFGQVIDVLVSARRDAETARRFFQQAIGVTFVAPTEVTTDQAPVYRLCWRSGCQRPGTAPTGMPTTESNATTAG